MVHIDVILSEGNKSKPSLAPEIVAKGQTLEANQSEAIITARLVKLFALNQRLQENGAVVESGKHAGMALTGGFSVGPSGIEVTPMTHDRSGLSTTLETSSVSFVKRDKADMTDSPEEKNWPLYSVCSSAVSALREVINKELAATVAGLEAIVKEHAADNKSAAHDAVIKLANLHVNGLASKGESDGALLDQVLSIGLLGAAHDVIASTKPTQLPEAPAAETPYVSLTAELAKELRRLNHLQVYFSSHNQEADAARLGSAADSAVVQAIMASQADFVAGIHKAAELAAASDGDVRRGALHNVIQSSIALNQLADANFIRLNESPLVSGAGIQDTTRVLLEQGKLVTLAGVSARLAQASIPEEAVQSPWPAETPVLTSSVQLSPLRADAKHIKENGFLIDVPNEDGMDKTISILDPVTGAQGSLNFPDDRKIIRVRADSTEDLRLAVRNFDDSIEIYEFSGGTDALVTKFRPGSAKNVQYNRELSERVTWDNQRIEVSDLKNTTWFKKNPKLIFGTDLKDITLLDAEFGPDSDEVVVLDKDGKIYELVEKDENRAELQVLAQLPGFSVPKDGATLRLSVSPEDNSVQATVTTHGAIGAVYTAKLDLDSISPEPGAVARTALPQLVAGEKMRGVADDASLAATQFGDDVCVWRPVNGGFKPAAIIHVPEEESVVGTLFVEGHALVLLTSHPHLQIGAPLIRVRRYDLPEVKVEEAPVVEAPLASEAVPVAATSPHGLATHPPEELHSGNSQSEQKPANGAGTEEVATHA